MRFWKPNATVFEKRAGLLIMLLIFLQAAGMALHTWLSAAVPSREYTGGVFISMMMVTAFISNVIFRLGQQHARLAIQQKNAE